MLRMFKIMKFLRMLKLLRVFKLSKLTNSIEEYIASDEIFMIINFIKSISIALFLAHWMACFYYYIGL